MRMTRKSIPTDHTHEEAARRFEAAAPESEQYTKEETIARREAMLKRMFSTPPQHRTAKGEKANPPKKRGRPEKDGVESPPPNELERPRRDK
jgi:hypothetical protein